MVKKLPGFTLIELLVAVTIAAILAAVSYSVFKGAQATVRDGQRISEINLIARSIEASKDYATGKYRYTLIDLSRDFPQRSPLTDPLGIPYCVMTDPPANSTSGFWDRILHNQWQDSFYNCSVTYPYVALSTSITQELDPNRLAYSAGVQRWKLCARMERAAQPYCVSSLTR